MRFRPTFFALIEYIGSPRRIVHGEKERVSESSGEVGAVGFKSAAPISQQSPKGKSDPRLSVPQDERSELNRRSAYKLSTPWCLVYGVLDCCLPGASSSV